ncbi:hypothetical protein POM88_011944 [Heracleum sosnowskyi]|uniref:Zinc-ribbon domain-containing protein n=1 Tax=Heracleum sosnowskyi TaxID=360622 RepID=A0AAD8IX53_9APIA|nr:hypothetical protein POM88_011944 [Heracleum sosnowskyi]
MTSQMNTKVRFVRCPRCRRVLPELADVPVYECGGCGTILQAKNQKKDTNDTGSLVHEADPTQRNGLDYLMSPSTDESDLEKILEKCGSGLSCRKEGLGDLKQSHKNHTSDVISCHENTGSLPEISGHAGTDEDELPLVQYGTQSHNELGDDDIELPGDIRAANKIMSSPELNHNEAKSLVHGPENLSPRKEDVSPRASENISYGSQIYSQNRLKELPTSTGFTGDLSSCYESCEDGDLSSVSGTDREVDESLKKYSIPEEQIRKSQSSPVASETPDNQMIPSSEPTKQAEEPFPVFQRLSSADTLENIPHVYARTDLGVTLRSSTAKHYYDYGVSTSCMETEIEIPSQHLRPSRKNFKDAEPRITNEMPIRDELVVNYGMSRENKLTPRPNNSLTPLSAKKHHTTKGSKWSRDEFQEPSERRRPVKVTAETGEYSSRPPIYLKDSQVVRNGNSTSYESKGLPARTVDPESKTQLLRMVYELQDQLKRVQMSKGIPHSRYFSGIAEKEQLPAYSNLFVPNGERYRDLRYAFNPGRLDQVKTYTQHGKVPRMAFSGDAAQFSHEVDCSCLRCYRQKWNYSAQLPRHAYYDEGHSVLYSRGPRHSSHSPYYSTSASPYQYSSFEFPWSHDMMLDVIYQNNHEVKKKQQAAKQHFRPIAGAAPIIACYSCNEILLLPADFLLLKRKCHRLRCSACTVVLKFSLVKGIRIVEYNREPKTPPPSEVGEYPETTNLASASCAVDYQHGDPAVSSCDGYEKSSQKSATDIEQSSPAPPSETMNGSYLLQKMSAGNPLKTKKDGKKPIEQDSRNSYNCRETFELGGPSSKVYEPENVFSEIEEVPPEGGSPLHQLMGYSSPTYIR